VQLVNGFFNVPIFTILFMGFVTRRVPAVAAKAGLAFFIGSYGVIEIFGLTRLHFLHLLAILFVVTCVLMWSFGRLWPMAEPYRLRVNNVVAVTPWRHRHWAALILLLMMVAMFIIFSPLGLAH
jgi:SSS family solute:Na+ symporter